MSDEAARERVTPRLLDWCTSAEAAVDALGRRLAPYLLTQEARAEAGLRTPHLPDRRGTATGLLVLQRPADQPDAWPALARAFVLPFLWKENTRDSAALPKGLAPVADQVREVTERKSWGLHLAEELDRYDLSGLTVNAPSLWAPLAAGLALAAYGGKPMPTVLGTGAWSPGGMTRVDEIEAKVAAAVSASGGVKPILFVPAANLEETVAAGQEQLQKVVAYPAGETDWKRALAEHLLELDVPPDRTHGLSERCAYANRQYVAQSKRRRKFYLNNLVDDLAAELAQRPVAQQRVGRLVLALSYSYEVCLLLLRTLRPEEARLLYTDKTEGRVSEIEEGAPGVKVTPVLVPVGEEEGELGPSTAWLEGEPDAAARAVEVTGGNKAATVLLTEVGRRAGARVLYLDHDHEDYPLFGTEDLRQLDWLT